MKNKKRHVCHLVYSFDVGGLERVIANCINNMDKSKFNHTIIALTRTGQFVQQIDSDVNIFAMNKREGNDFSLFTKIYKLLRKIKPDVVQTYNLATVELQLVAFLARVPVRIHSEHGRDSYDVDGSVKKYIYLRRFCSLFTHFFVTVSKDLYDWAKYEVKIPKNKLRLVVNGIDTDYFDTQYVDDIEETILENKFVFGHVSRLHSIKNQRLMLEAFKLAGQIESSLSKDAVLLIVGDGPDQKGLEKFVLDNNLNERVIFAGSKSNVRDYYKLFDVFLLSSFAEGIPMTLLESMSMSVPHIVTDVGGIKEVTIEGETGISVASEDVGSYAGALVKLFLDRELLHTMSCKARFRVEQNFSQRAMVEAYEKLYLKNT